MCLRKNINFSFENKWANGQSRRAWVQLKKYNNQNILQNEYRICYNFVAVYNTKPNIGLAVWRQ